MVLAFSFLLYSRITIHGVSLAKIALLAAQLIALKDQRQMQRCHGDLDSATDKRTKGTIGRAYARKNAENALLHFFLLTSCRGRLPSEYLAR
jgi:hypothetical protein